MRLDPSKCTFTVRNVRLAKHAGSGAASETLGSMDHKTLLWPLTWIATILDSLGATADFGFEMESGSFANRGPGHWFPAM